MKYEMKEKMIYNNNYCSQQQPNNHNIFPFSHHSDDNQYFCICFSKEMLKKRQERHCEIKTANLSWKLSTTKCNILSINAGQIKSMLTINNQELLSYEYVQHDVVNNTMADTNSGISKQSASAWFGLIFILNDSGFRFTYLACNLQSVGSSCQVAHYRNG